jgi:hypothetical protein
MHLLTPRFSNQSQRYRAPVEAQVIDLDAPRLIAEQGEALAAAVPPMASLLAAASPEPRHQPKQKRPEEAVTGAKISIQELQAAAEAANQPLDVGLQEGLQEAAAAAPAASAPAGGEAAPQLSAEDDTAAAQLEMLHALLLLLPPPEVPSLLVFAGSPREPRRMSPDL